MVYQVRERLRKLATRMQIYAILALQRLHVSIPYNSLFTFHKLFQTQANHDIENSPFQVWEH